jgi:hypothetical protein
MATSLALLRGAARDPLGGAFPSLPRSGFFRDMKDERHLVPSLRGVLARDAFGRPSSARQRSLLFDTASTRSYHYVSGRQANNAPLDSGSERHANAVSKV